MNVHEAALSYLRRGWSVVPIRPDGKMPLIKWAQYQTKRATPEEVDSWFDQWPDANIGVITGAISELVVIDIDPRNGGNLDKVGRVVATDLMSKTPGGGAHLWCKYPGKGVKLVAKPDEYEGVDIQADGRLVVVPPSRRSDGVYEWLRTGDPGSCPPWIFASESRRKKEEKDEFEYKPDWIASTLQGVAPGGRHTALTRLAGYFLKQDIPLDIAFGLLHAWNAKNSDPLPQVEIEKTASSLYQLHGADSTGKIGAARWFGPKGQFIPSAMGDTFRNAIPMITIHGTLYIYQNGVYADGEDYVAGRVAVGLREKFSTARVNEVVSYLRLSSKRESDEQVDFGNINCRNGLVSVRGQTIVAHDPDFISFAQIPHDWIEDATCPGIDAFIEESVPNDCCPLVYEIFGYCIYGDLPFREAVVLTGPSATGKSVLLGVLRRLVGRNNYSTVGIHSLADEKFHRAELVNMLANICGDLDSSTIKGAGVFKQLTGGDRLMAERKGKNPFTFRNKATMVFSANAPPRSGDKSDAWFTRWLVLPMMNKIDREKQDPYLLEKLTAKEEMQGLLIKATHALGDLLERGRFVIPDSVRKENIDYRERTDPMTGWISDQVIFGVDQRCRRSEIYESFKNHAQDAGFYAIPPSQEVYRRLRIEHGIEFYRTKGIWKARGVSVRAPMTATLIDD